MAIGHEHNLRAFKALTRRNVTDEFCVLHRSKAPPRAALCDVLMMAAFGQQRFPQVIFGFRLPPRKPGVGIPFIAPKVIAFQPRYPVGHNTCGVEHKLAAERVALHVRQPRNAMSRPRHSYAVLLLNSVDAAIDALAQF
jgi:hypothetical protein